MSLLGLMSLVSASALGAGKPTGVTQPSVVAGSWGINHVELKGTVNPNGADTTMYIEYREYGEEEFTKYTTPESVGSGTSQVSKTWLLTGLKPYGRYQWRTVATNKYGGVGSSITTSETPYWQIINGKSLNYVGGVATVGTATFEWKVGSSDLKIACQESGGASIGGEWGTGTGYSPNLTGCKLYENGKMRCEAYEAHIPMDQTFTVNGGYFNFNFPEGCFYSSSSFSAPEPFFVTMSGFNKEEQVQQPMVLTNKLKWAGITVNATISTNWSLTGVDSGKKFGALRAE